MSQFDLIERDPKKINKFVQIYFHDVIAEPEFTHSEDTLWSASIELFKCSKNIAYKLMTSVMSIGLSLWCGCFLGLDSFFNIWFASPCIKFQSIWLQSLKKALAILLALILAPLTDAFGLFFNRIGAKHAEEKQMKKSSSMCNSVMFVKRCDSGLSSKHKFSTQTCDEIDQYTHNTD